MPSTTCHIKLKHTSTFKAVTRKQPFLCRKGDPARNAYITVIKDENESLEAVTERLKRIDSTRRLCEGCASQLPQ